MFIQHEDFIINTANINYITVRKGVMHLIVHYDKDQSITLKFESLEGMEMFYDLLNK